MVQVMHVLLKHMILDVQTAQLLHVHELMQETRISEYQAQAVLIAREEEWVTFDASLRVPGAAPPSSFAPPPHRGGGGAGEAVPGAGAQVPAAAPGSTAVVALHPPGPIASGGKTRPIEQRKRPTRVYDMDFMLQCRVSSSAAPNAQRVQGQVKAIMGCDAAQSRAVAGDRLASPVFFLILLNRSPVAGDSSISRAAPILFAVCLYSRSLLKRVIVYSRSLLTCVFEGL
jgi:hypothetical protein